MPLHRALALTDDIVAEPEPAPTSTQPTPTPRYGHMTAERWLAEGHTGQRVVLFNGHDVTDACLEFDDTPDRSWAVVYEPGEARFHQRVYGVVTVVPAPAHLPGNWAVTTADIFGGASTELIAGAKAPTRWKVPTTKAVNKAPNVTFYTTGNF